MSLFVKKPLGQLLAQADEGEKGLKRTLGAGNLVALGIGAIIGAGLFVRTAAAAGQAAGPAVTISFIIAAIGCAFAGLCYAEFAAMIPIAGSAYAYSYVTMGELVAWIIGWALIMEYALGAATVSIAWSEYLNKLFDGSIPYEWCHSPFESFTDSAGVLHKGIINAPALVILLLLTLLLIKGTQESAMVNAVIVFIKVAIVILFIVLGWQYIRPENHTPYMIPEGTAAVTDSAGKVIADYTGVFKHGWGGVLGGAAIVFFAFIGFDAVSTAAQEAKNPKRDMPIGILGSLVVCTILYILFGHVLTGVANWQEFVDPEKGREASVAYAISTYMVKYSWLSTAVTVAILAGFSSVILVMLMGQSRIFYTMSNDGLIPKAFGVLHPKFKTPYKANWILFVFVGLFAAFVPGHVAGDLTSFGTLFAFVLVSAGVWILRVKSPEIERPFKTPLVPLVPILGVIVCTAMIFALDAQTLKVAFGWMALGLVVYFVYSRHHSKLRNGQ
ncbi:MAG: amino acid permease [Sediminibacterium sp. Gen4]|jgi:basic amino acid/polyamine antiporter, APA family|uniref:amino acid permease n=1 Tax=unclassified Sediminibacterium TaxID=2635961 RepID=UPI0015B8B80A|nr:MULTISPECIES: amino acid permease [unclassified Sediminibacterium]MBW0160459.1 amino acid permease [Sediminibacterium sp.]MBW0165432.1 amino acid permease [Sediminibacterium sp.]MDZ4070515.1 amino acid permease [Sediminibacterium sp.]NWK65375.1 amino acid permease [Sediminibacterium sp. Gen4]